MGALDSEGRRPVWKLKGSFLPQAQLQSHPFHLPERPNVPVHQGDGAGKEAVSGSLRAWYGVGLSCGQRRSGDWLLPEGMERGTVVTCLGDLLPPPGTCRSPPASTLWVP